MCRRAEFSAPTVPGLFRGLALLTLGFHDGQPQNLILNFDHNRVRVSGGSRAERPELIAGGNNNPILDTRDPNGYYDPTQFTLAPVKSIDGGTAEAVFFGNLARNSLTAPGVANVDFSLVKNTQITENSNLQFRAEFFNIINRANFGLPFGLPLRSRGRINPAAGIIDDTLTEARQIQLGLKFVF